MKKCSKCGEILENQNSTSSYCKVCKKESARLKRLADGIKPRTYSMIVDNTKQCTICKEFKDFSNFSPSIRGIAGLATACKPCMASYQLSNSTKEERREATQKYRNSNREWWRSLHRLHQFNRRKNIKAVSDNTVTKGFVEEVYNTCNCYYCNNEIAKEDRTLEHKQPLNKGGLHSATNIVMACKECNSTKRDMTEKEFKQYRLCQTAQK